MRERFVITAVTAVLAAAALSACGGARTDQRPGPPPPSNTATAPTDDPVVIVLERTSCYGECPAYVVTITAAGQVEYTGKRWVKRKGSAKSSIPVAKAHELIAAFEAAGIAHFPSTLLGGTTDVPEIHLQYRDKTIQYTGGEVPSGNCAEAVVRLAEAIDRAVDIDRWIGTEAEREALREAGQLR